MISALGPARLVYDLNTGLFANCLADLSDDDARRRIDDRSNNVAFLAAHIVDARHYLGKVLGLETPSPVAASLGDVQRVEDATGLPGLVELRQWWNEVTEPLAARLEVVTDADLAEPSPAQFPVADESVLGAVAFLIQHESYHIGQLALLRKQLGYSAMTYDPPTGGMR